jgi:hypothetical protein
MSDATVRPIALGKEFVELRAGAGCQKNIPSSRKRRRVFI